MMIGLPAIGEPGRLEAEHAPEVALLEDEHQGAERCGDREQRHDHGLDRDHDRAEQQEQDQRARPRVQAIAYGIVADWLAMKSWPCAARPPTSVVTPSTSTSRTSGTTSMPAGLSGASGLIAARRTVEPRM